jgi:hypothetical protein
VKRRIFLKTTAAGTILGGASFAVPSAYHALPSDSQNSPLVSIASSDDPALSSPAPLDALLTTEQVRDVVWMALDRDTSPRSLRSIVKKDSWVVIKPNIVCRPGAREPVAKDGSIRNWEGVPDITEGVDHWGLVTDLRVVKAIAEYLIEKAPPKRITIAEGPPWFTSGGKYEKATFVDGWHCTWKGFGGLSYAGIVEELNGRNGVKTDIVDLNEDDAVYVTDFDPHKTGRGAFQFVETNDPDSASTRNPGRRKGIWLPRTIMERNVLISVPVLKTHSTVGLTLCMKNLIGCVHSQSYNSGNYKAPIHKGSAYNVLRGIVDLAAAIRPDYGIMEGFWATKRMFTGQNGVIWNHNVVIAGGDVVAAESVANQTMGFHPLDNDLLRMCYAKKLGEWRPDRITIAGPRISSVSRRYERSPYVYSGNRGETMYFARGIRKWFLLGPINTAWENPGTLAPTSPGAAPEGEWRLLDGDFILDESIQLERNRSMNESLLYTIPGSKEARPGAVFYLFIRANTSDEQLVGQILVGVKGSEYQAFFNGRERPHNTNPNAYAVSSSPFVWFQKGENSLLLEIKKTASRGEEISLAANLCDLDGNRLPGLVFDPAGE